MKHGPGSQGVAILDRYEPLAGWLGFEPCSLPKRPTERGLVSIVREQRRDGLRREILDAAAPLVVTLGNEALAAVAAVADDVDGVPERLTPTGYGRTGRLLVAGAPFDLLPLVHPGFRRQAANRPDWQQALAAWSPNLPGDDPAATR